MTRKPKVPIKLLHEPPLYETTAATSGIDPNEQKLRDVLLGVFNWSPDSTEARDTPARFLKYLKEFHHYEHPSSVLGTTFPINPSKDHGIVVQGNIPFRMICEHHLLPAIGKAWVGYLPRQKVVGLSKIARLVDAVGTRRPGMQEKICAEIADVLNGFVDANGTICVIRSMHTCMACRGIYCPDTVTTSSAVRGVFLTNPAARQEFFQIAGIGGQ